VGNFLASGGGALLGGLLGALGGVLGARWTNKTSRREHVWKRVEWALDLILQPQPRAQNLGYVALEQIIGQGLADARDVVVLVALASAAFEELADDPDVDDAEFVIDDPDEGPDGSPEDAS